MTALITGASAGLGAEFARQLAARGTNLALVARRKDKLDALAADLRAAHGVEVTTFVADLADPAAPEALAGELATAGLEISWLVNNAGASGPDLLLERNWQQHRQFLQLMMESCVHLMHLLIPGMQARGFGRVINVASVAGRVPRAGDTCYGPSKAYLIALSENLNLTLRPDGVHVCALCPGFVHTEFHAVADMLEMKNSSPDLLWYTADVVVREGLAAVDRGKAVQVSGRLYRLVDPFMQSVWTRWLFRVNRHRPSTNTANTAN